MNYTPEISEYASFSWFQWSWFYDETLKIKQLYRWLGHSHVVGQSFCSYILTNAELFITRSSAILIDEHELTTDYMTKRCKNFIKRVEAKFGNSKQPLFDGMDPDRVYYSSFGDTEDTDNNVLPYGEDIQYQKEVEVNEAYIEALLNYIEAKIVVPGKYSILVLAQVKLRKRYALGSPIGKDNRNPILDTRVHELEFPDGRVDKYVLTLSLRISFTRLMNRDGILEFYRR